MTNGLRLQLMAWAIVVVAFCCFMVVVLGVPWLTREWIAGATLQETALIERRSGTVKLEREGVTVLLDQGSLQSAEVTEGTVVTTQSDGRALIRFFDDATLSIEPGMRVTLQAMRRPRFGASSGDSRVQIRLEAIDTTAALAQMGTTWRSTDYRVELAAGALEPEPESRLRLRLEPRQTRVHTLEGQVAVAAAGERVMVSTDRAAYLRPGEPPGRPGPALENILTNGDFRRSVETGWIPSTAGETPAGLADVTLETGRRAVTIRRVESAGRPGNVSLKQDLGSYELQDATFLGVSATFRVDHQSLTGGDVGTEYPLILKLTVEPQAGATDEVWTLGFYGSSDLDAVTDPGDAAIGIVGVPVPAGEWVTFHSGNLLLPDSTGRLEIPAIGDSPERIVELESVTSFDLPPRRLLMFEVYASGHDYLSHVDRSGIWLK